MSLHVTQLIGFGVAGAASDVVSLVGAGVIVTQFDPDTATAMYGIYNDGGEKTQVSGGSLTTIGTWVIPTGNVGNYECRLTVNSGDNPIGSALATWLSCSLSRTWTLSQSGAGTKSNSCTIEIRPASGSVVATQTVTMDVTVI